MYLGSTLVYGSAPTGTLYGRVYHYSDYTIDVENDVITVDTTSQITYTDLLSSTEYNNLTNTDFYTVNGHALPRDAITSFEFGSSVTSTPYQFLNQAANLTSVDFTYATSMTSIGAYFLASCPNFNSAITFPSGITTIQEGMLQNCTSFNQNITFPSSLTSLGAGCMFNCKAMIGTINVGSIDASNFPLSNNAFATTDSTAACYVTGIEITGSGASSWTTHYPNSYTASYYRKLILLDDGGGEAPDDGEEAGPE
jgi:hypothetical protein